MSTKKNTPVTQDDKFLDSLAKKEVVEFELNSNQKLFFFFVAQISTLLPSYLYQGVKGLEFSGLSIILFLVVSTSAAYLLYLGYLNIFKRTRLTLGKRYDQILESNVKKPSELKEQLLDLGTTGYSLLFSNTLYLGMTLFIGFYVLQKADVRVSYTFSLISSAAALYYVSTTEPRSKSD